MKYFFSFLLLIALAGSSLIVQAQVNVVYVEYFFDLDPGFGNATSVSVTASPNVSLNFTPDISGLPDGYHTLFVRAKDANSAWSLVQGRTFYKFTITASPPAPNIQQAEYFIDNDPGFGAATQLTVSASNNITIAVPTLNIASLSDGFHNLYVRAMDTNGTWSSVEVKTFYKFTLIPFSAPANIVQAEYFIDNDPGYGAATSLVVTASNNQTIAIPTLNISSLADGFHNIYVRAKDANGIWSSPEVKTFYKFTLAGSPGATNIVQAEYFFDTDLGVGAGTSIPVTPGSNVTLTFTANIAALPDGFHNLYVRGKDANGIWSGVEAKVFYKSTPSSTTPINIVLAEYFFDADPGYGNGTAFGFTPAPNVTITPLPLDISSLSLGTHLMYVRAKDATGKWSVAVANSFSRTASSPTITSFSPGSGPIGTTVVLTGTNFDPVPANNVVQFNGVTTTVSASTSTSITTIVPAGATTGPIKVSVAALSGTSSTSFTVTPHALLGNVVQLNGTTDYIEVPDNASIRPASLTLEAWVNFASIPSFGPIFNKVVGSGINDSYQLFYLNGVLKGTVESLAGLNTFAQVTWTPVLGQWYHIAFTYDDTNKSETLYIDGIVVATNVVAASPQYDGSPMYVGGDRDNGTTYYSFPGKIDEARIWSTARTAGEILGTINSSLTGAETGLAAYYKMDETGQGAGILVANSAAASGAAINGTTFGTSCTPIFTLLPSPSITSFSPSGGSTGTVVTITGANFTGATAVSFGGTPAITFSVVSATSITATIPAGATTGLVVVTGLCSTGSSSSNFTVNPTATINITVEPVSAALCEGGNASFSIAASGTTNITYQWQLFNGIAFLDVSNGGALSGVTTASLAINTTGNVGAGIYRCRVSGDFASDVFSSQATLTVNALPAPPNNPVDASACGPAIETLSVSGGSNGQYRWYTTSTGGSPIAGETNSSYVTPSLSTTTTYYAAINNGTCESTRTAVNANIITSPVPTIASFTPSLGLVGTTVSLTGTNFTGATVVSFGGTAATSFSVVSSTSLTAVVPVAASTGVISVTSGCSTGNSATNFTVVPPATITISSSTGSAAVCDGAAAAFAVTASGTTNITYQWQWFNGSVYADLTNGNGYGGVTTSSLSVNTTGNFGGGNYQCRISGDFAPDVFSNPATLTVNPLPAAPVSPVNGSSCGAGSVLVSVSGGVNGQYVWYTVPSGGTAIAGEVNASYTTPSLANTTTYYAAINNGTCESTRTTVIANIINTTPPAVTGGSGCPGSTFTLQASGGVNGQYAWYASQTGGTALAGEVNSSFVTPALSVNTTYYVSVTSNGCESPRSPVTASILTTGCSPVIAPETLTTVVEGKIVIDLLPLISTVGTLDINSLKITKQPSSGASARIAGSVLTIDYAGIAFSGLETLTIEVCNTNGLCTQQDFTLEVAGDIQVYNAVSPNGDGLNDFLYLRYIDILAGTKQNKVIIFNRWGDEVFSVNDYNNQDRVFTGFSNGGSKLPAGTYFYKIVFANGAGPRTGFLELRY